MPWIKTKTGEWKWIPTGGVSRDTVQKMVNDALKGSTPDAVQFVPQELTPEQQEQARENIDALGQNDLLGAVRVALEQAKESGEFDGKAGIPPHIGANGNWYIGDVDTGIKAAGSDASVTVDSIRNALGYTPADAKDTAKTPVFVNGTFTGDGIRIDSMTCVQLNEITADRDVVIIAFSEDNLALVVAKCVPDFGAVGTLYLIQDGANMQSVECIIGLTDNGQGGVAGYLTLAHAYIADGIKAEIANQAAAGMVKSVNGTTPDENGNVEIEVPDRDKVIETTFAVNEVQRGRYSSGVLDTAAKSICTIDFVRPFVMSMQITSPDYRYCVTVYNNGAYVRTEGWLDSDTTYEFDHAEYQYKVYVGRVDNEYIYDMDDCRQSVKLTISTDRILDSYRTLEIQADTERRNTKMAVENAMRRHYDISYANAPAPLNLITYAGDNQIVHPKVLYFPNKFGRHRFWIAYNPYPRANAIYENPCVAYSDDGYEWTNIPANPLDDPGEYGINTDVHLVYVEAKNRLEVWWRYADDKDGSVELRREIIYRRTSTDGLNWTEREEILNNDSGDTVQHLSPCILHDGSQYRVWAVNDTEGIVKYYEGMEAIDATLDETIALNDEDLMPGAFLTNGNIEASDAYKHTDKIKLSASKTFSLTGKNKNGVPYHIPIRRIVAFDADGNRLPDYSINTNTEGSTISSMPTRYIVMNESVDSVVLTLYQPEYYTEKTLTLKGADGGTSELSFVRDIPLTFPDDGVGHRLWHIDVIEDNGKMVMLPMCRARDSSVATEQTWSLFLCTSDDNVTFTNPTQVLVGNPYGWDKQIYRSSIVNVDGEYRIYYTAQNEIQQHGLGVCTSRTLSNFVGKW